MQLDTLEAFHGAGDERNLYERKVVEVEILSDVDLSTDGTDAAALTCRVVRKQLAWTYFAVVQPSEMGGRLVPHGHWRRFLAETGETDVGDEWATPITTAKAASSPSLVAAGGGDGGAVGGAGAIDARASAAHD